MPAETSIVNPTANSAGTAPLTIVAWTELRMGLRDGMFRFVAALLVALGWSVGSVGGRGVAMSAYATGETACQYLGVAVTLWVSMGAVRETALRTEALIFTKPQPPERLALARFLGIFGQVLCFLCALFLGAIIGRLFAEGNLFGFPAYGLQFLRAAGVLFFAASASYCLALLADSVTAGALVTLYWIVAMAGRAFLAKFYFPWYTQNLPAYVLIGVGLLGFALWFSRRSLRGESKAALSVRVVAPVSLLLGFSLLWATIRGGHDPLAVQSPALERMASQTILQGQLTPGFLLPDQHGKPTRLSQFPGRILFIALWSPRDADSTLMLSQLDVIARRHGAAGVTPVAICLSEDTGAAATFAAGERLDYPMVYDWGTYNATKEEETSPLAVAYNAARLPRLVVTDRRHRVRAILEGLDTYEGSELERVLLERLKEEPE